MPDISINVDTARIDALFEQLRAKLGDLSRPMAEIGEVIVASVHRNFEEGRSPAGPSWKPSRRAMREGGQTLVNRGMSGGLLGSINYQAHPDHVEVGTNKIHAAIHQFGGVIKPKKGRFLAFPGAGGETVFLRQVEIPARPYLGLRDDDWPEIEDILLRHLTG